MHMQSSYSYELPIRVVSHEAMSSMPEITGRTEPATAQSMNVGTLQQQSTSIDGITTAIDSSILSPLPPTMMDPQLIQMDTSSDSIAYVPQNLNQAETATVETPIVEEIYLAVEGISIESAPNGIDMKEPSIDLNGESIKEIQQESGDTVISSPSINLTLNRKARLSYSAQNDNSEPFHPYSRQHRTQRSTSGSRRRWGQKTSESANTGNQETHASPNRYNTRRSMRLTQSNTNANPSGISTHTSSSEKNLNNNERKTPTKGSRPARTPSITRTKNKPEATPHHDIQTANPAPQLSLSSLNRHLKHRRKRASSTSAVEFTEAASNRRQSGQTSPIITRSLGKKRHRVNTPYNTTSYILAHQPRKSSSPQDELEMPDIGKWKGYGTMSKVASNASLSAIPMPSPSPPQPKKPKVANYSSRRGRRNYQPHTRANTRSRSTRSSPGSSPAHSIVNGDDIERWTAKRASLS